MKKVIVLALMAVLAGCGEMVDDKRAVSTMESAGYKDVKVTGKHGFMPGWAGCDAHDSVAFDVSATNPLGAHTSATVCCGLFFKGCTIRH